MTVGVGIVGCGLIGRKRLAGLPSDARLVGCFDVDASRSAALAAEAGDGSLAASSLEDLLAREGIDVVVVAVVHDQLAPLTLAALRAGCHVLVEKPGAIDRQALAEVRDVAAGLGLEVRVGYNHRFHPSFAKLRELRRDRDDGRFLFVRARYGHGGRLGYETEWRADRSVSGGGELVDQGSHLIDLTRSLVGEVSLRHAELPTLYWPMAVEDNAFLSLEVAAGGVAWLHASWTEWKNLFSFELTFERTKYEVAGLGGSYGPEQLTVYSMGPELGPPETTSWGWPPGDDSWSCEMSDVIGVIRGVPGSGIGASVDDALAVLSVVEEAYRR